MIPGLYDQNYPVFPKLKKELFYIFDLGGNYKAEDYSQGKSLADKKANTFSKLLKGNPFMGKYTVTVFVEQINKIILLKKYLNHSLYLSVIFFYI